MNNRQVDYDKLYELILLAKGEHRSVREYVRDGGFSRSLIYMIRDKTLVPGFKTIFTLTSNRANPQNGITFTQMMWASGYPKEDYEQLKNELEKLHEYD